MRALALAAMFGAGMALAGIAAAEPWTDPNGRLKLDAPHGWTVRPQNMQGGTAVLAFTPSSDCFFFGIPNPASADASVSAVRHTDDPIAPEAWATAVLGVPDFADAGTATVLSQSVDTSGFWPVQRAQLQVGSRTVQGALQVRPGVELRAFCSGGSGSFDAIINSLGHPNDQAWEAAAAAAPTTPEPAPAPAPDGQ